MTFKLRLFNEKNFVVILIIDANSIFPRKTSYREGNVGEMACE